MAGKFREEDVAGGTLAFHCGSVWVTERTISTRACRIPVLSGCLTSKCTSLHLPTMLLLGVLTATALVVQGDIKATVDVYTYVRHDSGKTLEVTVLIPFPSLIFMADQSGLVARFRTAVQLFDRRGEPVAGRSWLTSVNTGSYGASRDRDSVASAVFEIAVPPGAVRGRVDIVDLSSDRTAWSSFDVGRPESGCRVQLLKSGRLNPAKVYGLSDTLEAVLKDWGRGRQGTVVEPESVVFAIGRSGRELARFRATAAESAGSGAWSLKLPVVDSSERPRLVHGTYCIQAWGYVADSVVMRSAAVPFSVELPFYYSDSGWRYRVERLIYLASVDEIRRLRAVPAERRQAVWDSFWRPRDPDPGTRVNEREEEYFSRIDYADQHFGGADKGYRSDRGRVYVTYGAPDAIESKHFEIDRPAQQIWYYYSRGLVFMFVDRFGWGEFVLVSQGEPYGQ